MYYVDRGNERLGKVCGLDGWGYLIAFLALCIHIDHWDGNGNMDGVGFELGESSLLGYAGKAGTSDY